MVTGRLLVVGVFGSIVLGCVGGLGETPGLTPSLPVGASASASLRATPLQSLGAEPTIPSTPDIVRPPPTDTPTPTSTPTAAPTATPRPTRIPEPVARFTWRQTGSLTIKFKNTSNAPGATWSWNFGSFAPLSTKKSPSQAFNDPGTYPVTLTATNRGGSDSFTASVVVEPAAPTSPNAHFTWEPGGVNELQFSNQSSEDVQEWRWDFGDGSDPLGPCNCPNPTHTFPAGGQEYSVTLLVSNGENSDDVTYIVFVGNG